MINSANILEAAAIRTQEAAARAWKARCDGWQAGLTMAELNALQRDYDAAARIEREAYDAWKAKA
jgi:hypothetical protein